MNMNEVLAAISNMNNEQLTQSYLAMKDRRDYLSRQATRVLRVGAIVDFDRGPRRGGMVRGRVTKINGKTVVVDVGGNMTWRVAPGLLTVAENS